MKKVLKGELISLAHSILQLKDKDDVHVLKLKAQLLHEKLSVLAYAEKHFEGLQPTLGKNEFVAYLASEVELEEVPNEDKTAENTKGADEAEKEKDDLALVQEEVPMPTNKTPSREEDFGVHYDQLPQFEAKKTEEEMPSDEVTTDDALSNENEEVPDTENTIKTATSKEDVPDTMPKEATEIEQKPIETPSKTIDLFSQDKKSLNDQLRSSIKIGLNDRIAFVKHLFNNDATAYNQSIEKLNSFSNAEEALRYLETQVKPIFQNWTEKEEFEQRFIELVTARFE